MAEEEGEREAKENVEVRMCCPLASPPHRAACYLWDHHLPPACVELPLPLSIGRLRAPFALGFLKAVPGRMRSPFDVSFSWIREEAEGWLRAELPRPLGAFGLPSQLRFGLIRLCE